MSTLDDLRRRIDDIDEELVRLIAGSLDGHAGPGDTHTPITYAHATVAPGAELVVPWNREFNAMVYVRGHRGDFDDWAAAGNPGWAYADVLPYFIKSEDHVWGASEYHGAGGPMHISDYSTAVHPLCHRFIASCGAINIPPTNDFNGALMEGAGTWQMTIVDHASSDETSAEAERAAGRLRHPTARRLPEQLSRKA